MMQYRQMGKSGLVVSVVGVGCNAFGARIDVETTGAVVDAAVDEGITLFDTADIYGFGESETLLGKALGDRRDDVVIATKFGMDMHGANGPDWDVRGSRRYIRKAVDASLRRLGTDWIDLYQMHAPDPWTPIEETLAALHELILEGKVRYIGSSNLAAWQLIDADWVARSNGFERFISAQNKYSMYDRSAEAELLPAAMRIGVGVIPYLPLEHGLLTGKYRRGEPAPEGSRLATRPFRLSEADFDRIETLERFAADRGIGVLDVAIGGLAARQGVVSVVAGATLPEQIRANVRAAEWQPTPSDQVSLESSSCAFNSE